MKTLGIWPFRRHNHAHKSIICYKEHYVSEHVQVIARVEPEIKAALDQIKETQGIMLEYQIRMGLLMWLESKGVHPLRVK